MKLVIPRVLKKYTTPDDIIGAFIFSGLVVIGIEVTYISIYVGDPIPKIYTVILGLFLGMGLLYTGIYFVFQKQRKWYDIMNEQKRKQL